MQTNPLSYGGTLSGNLFLEATDAYPIYGDRRFKQRKIRLGRFCNVGGYEIRYVHGMRLCVILGNI